MSELSKAEKKGVYLKADRFFEENDLKKVRKFFLEMTELDERLDWLIRLKNFFKRYKSASLDELWLIKNYFGLDDTFDNNEKILQRDIQMWHEERFYTTKLNLQSAIDTYSPLIGSLDYHLSILEELDTLTYGYHDQKSGELVLKHPIDGQIAERYYKQYMRKKKSLIEALLDLYPIREAFIKIVPNNLKRTNPSGRKPMYPVRRELTQSFWKKNKEKVKKQAKEKFLKRVKDKAKDEDKSETKVKLNMTNIPARDIVEELKTQIPFVAFLKTDTIKTWIRLK